MAEPDQNGRGDESYLGFKVPRSLTRPLSNFATKFLDNLANNPVACIAVIFFGVHVGIAYYAVETVMPRAVRQIDDGYQEQASRFTDELTRQRDSFERMTDTAHGRAEKEREREREFLRDVQGWLKANGASLPLKQPNTASRDAG
jgi:hypothetical protein